MSVKKHVGRLDWLWSGLLAAICVVNCELTRRPSDVYGVTGSSVILHCSTNLSVPVQWEFKRSNHLPNEPWALVYFGHPTSQISAQYRNKNKYNVTVDSTGNEYNLIIYNLQTDDAGTYRCIDDYGFGGHKHDEGIPGHEYRADVVTIEGDLTCSLCINGSYINQTSFLLEKGYILKIFCSLTYVGNKPPTVSWILYSEESGVEQLQEYPQPMNSERRSGGHMIIESEVEINSTSITQHSYIRCNVTEGVNTLSLSDDISSTSHVVFQIVWTSSIRPIWVEGRHSTISDIAKTATITLGLCILFGVLLVAFIITVILLFKSRYIITKRQAISFLRELTEYDKNLIDSQGDSDLEEIHKKQCTDYKNRIDQLESEQQALKMQLENKNDELKNCYKDLIKTREDLEMKLKENRKFKKLLQKSIGGQEVLQYKKGQNERMLIDLILFAVTIHLDLVKEFVNNKTSEQMIQLEKCVAGVTVVDDQKFVVLSDQ